MKILFCNKCQEKIKEVEKKNVVTIRIKEITTSYNLRKNFSMDLCENCLKVFLTEVKKFKPEDFDICEEGMM